jgi:hypothetical protein
MNYITPKYKELECLSIVNNQYKYSEKAIEKAKEFLSNIVKKEPTPVTEEQRNELKLKYKNIY